MIFPHFRLADPFMTFDCDDHLAMCSAKCLCFCQVLMAIDDSASMADCGTGALALAAMTTIVPT